MIKFIAIGMAIASSAILFSLCDAFAKVWAQNPFSKWLLLIALTSPIAYMIFGYVTKTYGLALSSVIVNILIALITPLIGLFYFKEWNSISLFGYIGMASALFGLFLIIFFGQK